MTSSLPTLLAAAAATFVATNIDDLVLLTGWFSDRSYRGRHIAVGQFLGIATLIAASALLGLAGLLVPTPIMGILGVVPAGIGISRLIRSRMTQNHHAYSATKGVLAVAGVTIAHGSDNIAIYVPLFATQTAVGMFTIAAVFLLMTGAWVVLARWFVHHPAWGPAVQSWGRRIVPWVLILLGASIVYGAGTIGWLAKDSRAVR
jgi:cadmium resistance protein CadD (predicted permease)